jgi:hypothetical protein
MLLLGAAALPGCLAAAAAGAGAATGVYLTSRGAESLVKASPSRVAANTQATFAELGITQTGSKTENGGDKQEFTGTKGDLDITVQIERKDPTTSRIEVAARKNVAEWDKDYAREVLSKIVAKSS